MPNSGSVAEATTGKESLLVSMEEFAELAGVPLNTARYWRATDRGPKFVRIGRRIMARRADVAEWIDEQFASAS